jgi:hypothetical protein
MTEHGQNTDNLRMVSPKLLPKRLKNLVEPMGVEPTTSRVRSCHTFPGLPIPGRNIQRF